jgi:hypothetical protein
MTTQRQRERQAEVARAHVARLLAQARDHLAAIPDPATRELAARGAVEDVRRLGLSAFAAVRDDALRALHDEHGTWAQVGKAIGISREMAWRPPTPKRAVAAQ